MSDSTEKKEIGAKDISLASMVLAAVWIGVWSAVKALWGLFSSALFGLEMKEILWSGIAIAGVFSPVFVSIVLDKIKGAKSA
jgi:hypothetical protein